MGQITRKWAGTLSVALPIVWACLVGASQRAAAEEWEGLAPFRVQLRPHIEAARAVERALNGADQRLADAACLEVLTDFEDAPARRLKEALEANDVSARTYLRWIVFAQDQGSKACRSRGTVAVTEPGSRVVFICATAFLEMALNAPERAEAILIHEMLHTLGLGENPPSSKAITERVLSRCVSRPRVR